MKLIVLAAGEGTRLRPLTNDRPKCMVEFKDKPILDYIIGNADACKINDVNVVVGYQNDAIREHLKGTQNITFYENPKYATTNMVSTLFCAEEVLEGDCVVSYADIVYNKGVLDRIMDEPRSAIVVDRQWRKLWEMRMENPLDDAETLKLDEAAYVTELGKKPTSYDDIEGQYIGLIKFGANDIERIKSIYADLDRTAIYDGKNFDNMFMTSFLQILIDKGVKFKATFIDGGWVEIDSLDDLQAYKDYEV